MPFVLSLLNNRWTWVIIAAGVMYAAGYMGGSASVRHEWLKQESAHQQQVIEEQKAAIAAEAAEWQVQLQVAKKSAEVERRRRRELQRAMEAIRVAPGACRVDDSVVVSLHDAYQAAFRGTGSAGYSRPAAGTPQTGGVVQ